MGLIPLQFCLRFLSVLIFFLPATQAEGEIFLEEHFKALERWEGLEFSAVPRHSSYEIVEQKDGHTILAMRSDNAGSALLLKAAFKPRTYPVIEWRWRVEEAPTGINHTQRSGDDYPVRLYAFFEYTGEGLSMGNRLQSQAYRALRGQLPPHSAIAFVWAANEVTDTRFPNPYSSRVMMRVLRGPETPRGAWRSEKVEILEEYRALFDRDPPEAPMRLAVMTDSDDSGQSTRAAIDFIRVRGK